MAKHRWNSGLAVLWLLAAATVATAAPTTQPANSSTPSNANSSTASAFSHDPTTLTSMAPSSDASGDFGNMSIEELLNVVVATPAGLTPTDERALPVDVTELDAKDIEQSGARNLDEVMNIYVPNVQIMDHNSSPQAMGIRGIISDREDKYLYQVNGVTMNNRMLFGAADERDLPIMGDINTLDVVRGPASATYGSGALAGVVDVNTYNGLTFNGADVTVKQGIGDQYTTGEVRFGRQFTDTSGLFVYYGAAQVQGQDAPYFFGQSQPAVNGLPANIAGQQFTGGPIANVGEAAFGLPYQKAHVSYVNGPFEIWFRYVQDGTDTRPARNIFTGTKPASESLADWLEGRETLNQVYTNAISFKKDVSDQWNLSALASYDLWVNKDQRAGVSTKEPTRVSNENQLFGQVIANWKPVSSQSIAVGTEFSQLWYHDPPQSDALDLTPVVPTRDWQTQTFSLFGEDQWKFAKGWTSFIDVRGDKNTYQYWLVSPRGTIVYEPNKKDTYKVMAGQSVRRADDEDIWGQWYRTRTYPDPEKLLTAEISYDHKFTDQLDLAVDSFYEDYHAVGWDPSATEESSLGHFQIAGGEIVLTYKTDSTRIMASEGISQLVYGSVPGGSPPASQGISSAPYGFGNDLAAWAPSVTKLSITHDLDKHWSCSTSVVWYSGFPGAQNYANYAATLVNPPAGVPLSDPGYSTPYGPDVYWNVGLEFRPDDHWTFRVDGYDLAYLFDRNTSKINEILRESEFSTLPASLGVSVRYKF
jgi:outer membrane receptor protein involved in Fe transport